MASYNTELYRKGPGILLRDIRAGQDPQIDAVLAQIVLGDADVIALQGIDYDLQNLTLRALRDALRSLGLDYPHIFSAPPNAGLQTTLDLDGDGKTGGPGDAQGYGRFFGQGSMALLSRYPVMTGDVQNYATLLWRDLPDALLPQKDGKPFPSAPAQEAQYLASHGAWVVPIAHPELGPVTLLTYHASPPVFDGPEDRNGKRNHDETMFWIHYLNGAFGPAPQGRFVLLGDANLDPDRGDGLGRAMARLLAHPALQDPLPDQPTVIWPQTGPLRVDYVLPSADWTIIEAQVMPRDPSASRHALVRVTLRR